MPYLRERVQARTKFEPHLAILRLFKRRGALPLQAVRLFVQIERRTLLKNEPSTSETVWLVAPIHNPRNAAIR